ncbi:putative Pre-mRNA-splicing factor prp5 [Paratrimastix pyriformis]|uniref:Pre-mRNA-splicing factor prp5 n=1 Tax=Paratrimastix pyriformis TaxID=342808 RepID=A0ABQ8UP91_9EUKA|nr:putative Pre-mRNA-splicing factor prp5 [Paratrimastix pyriformis]
MEATMEQRLATHILDTKKLFFSNWRDQLIVPSDKIGNEVMKRKIEQEYAMLQQPAAAPEPASAIGLPAPLTAGEHSQEPLLLGAAPQTSSDFGIPLPPPTTAQVGSQSTSIIAVDQDAAGSAGASAAGLGTVGPRHRKIVEPKWHAPWKLLRVGPPAGLPPISLRTCSSMLIWDLASGVLKLTLTGHVSVVRGLAISDRHPYLFSCGEDKQVKCWDLEQNKVVRSYHGHLSGVYSIAVHPTVDVLITGGRDSTARVWDMRTKAEVHVLSGHTNTVASIAAQGAQRPQVVTGSMDSTIRLWDLRTGTPSSILTHHKKSIRALALHPTEFSFASGAADNIKKWRFPEGRFISNLSGHNAIINCLAFNNDNVLFSGGDNGSIGMWDWPSGYKFQQIASAPQPGSLSSEAGIYCCTFDRSGCRLITGEADKSIKVWGEDPDATPETHPIEWSPEADPKKW